MCTKMMFVTLLLIGILSLITFIFILLKITNAIKWSWWTVFSPFLIVNGIILVILVIYGLFLISMLLLYEWTGIIL